MLNENDFENALKSAYEERLTPSEELSDRILKKAANRIAFRQARIVSCFVVIISVFLTVVVRLLVGVTPFYYATAINTITIVIGVAVLSIFYPMATKSVKGV